MLLQHENLPLFARMSLHRLQADPTLRSQSILVELLNADASSCGDVANQRIVDSCAAICANYYPGGDFKVMGRWSGGGEHAVEDESQEECW